MARYIDAEKAVMTALSLTRLYDSDYQRGYYAGMDAALEIIAAEPTADVALVKRGEWERMINPYGELEGFMCECGHQSQAATNYCPNCGALNNP